MRREPRRPHAERVAAIDGEDVVRDTTAVRPRDRHAGVDADRSRAELVVGCRDPDLRVLAAAGPAAQVDDLYRGPIVVPADRRDDAEQDREAEREPESDQKTLQRVGASNVVASSTSVRTPKPVPPLVM
jgi:hypothetical protein